jgi:sec-independent protein translocase protein TatA
MLGNTFGLPHLIIILVIILLLFGAPKLPGLARSIGQSMKIFRTEVKSDDKAADKGSADRGTAENSNNADSPNGSDKPQSDQPGNSSTQSQTER